MAYRKNDPPRDLGGYGIRVFKQGLNKTIVAPSPPKMG